MVGACNMTTNMSEPSDPLQGLLGGLKPRRAPPAQAQAYATLKAAWQAQRRPAWHRYGGMAVAATVTAFAVNLWMMNPAAEDVCFLFTHPRMGSWISEL